MTVETARKHLEGLKEKNDIEAINQYGKALELNLKRNPNSESNKARLQLYTEIFSENKKSKKSE